MQLLHLYYFKLLAENEHLLNTAKQIHISPPALSCAISKLENELNVRLFDKVGRNIKLNENGKILYVHASNILSEIDMIKSAFTPVDTDGQKIIKIAITAMSLWTDVIGNFMIDYPNIVIHHTVVQKEQLTNGEFLDQFDFIITDIHDISNRAWDSSLIIEDPPALLVSSSHAFASRDSIALAEAKNESFIALSKGYSSRDFFDSACKTAGFVPRIIAETDYMLRSKLIKNGTGIGFSSVLGGNAISSPELKIIPLDGTCPPRKQSVFYKKNQKQSTNALLFKKYLIDFYCAT